MSGRRLIHSAVILSLSAGTIPVHAQARLEVTEVWSTKGDPARPFGDIAGMIEAPGGNIFVSDPVNIAVYAIDPASRAVQQIARQGKGPGEVQNPALFAAAPSGAIALWDLGLNAILLVDSQFRELKRIPLRQLVVNPKGFTILPDSSFVLSGGTFRSEFGIHRFSAAGEHLASWFPAPESKSRAARIQLAGAPISTSSTGRILLTRPAPHLIAKLNPATGEITRIAEDSTVLDPIGDDFEKKTNVDGHEVIAPQWYYSQSRGVWELKDGSILNVITRRYDGQSTWELYDSHGGLRARRDVDRAYRPFALTAAGRILATYADPQTDETVAVLLELHRP